MVPNDSVCGSEQPLPATPLSLPRAPLSVLSPDKGCVYVREHCGLNTNQPKKLSFLDKVPRDIVTCPEAPSCTHTLLATRREPSPHYTSIYYAVSAHYRTERVHS